ncbi:2-oxo acid dehydrogenase subunit E2 [Colwellia sp. MB3u-28]|nr:2-oxo acid dehydrogenase subunit E2 [Colwellia sp. MB02u-7]MBA6238051.1 2-oxo acid dehydrogenase subunit E2 [Colwellia sp. MB02u-11]MBA6257622.1 2-oxo acid dehydrogenase subunit E2 [Colwellia sp. MB3u-28]MBA6259379.1 2-oxo acid dehydrogenase subunit E2 [Colwellia sp. MB3u-41]MBA6300701.1 2-oxo acid dehydrogenase subunit E2 [Colwellia sp. MB3u-22]MBA6304418.1 2-oxo acid dehydrogenase subunit E2 [Colwellia sp. MB02u-14]MBA6311400.1 2-oxo acid dehydrogenase subunit E2 [Colwellia sp. MB3u-64]
MPSLGADMTEGTLTQWLVKEGDKVNSGDIIAVLETQKGAIDMEVYSSGTITEILVEPVIEVPVGTILARIALAEPSNKIVKSVVPAVDKVNETSVPVVETSPVNKQVNVLDVKISDVKASPIARRLAKEQQINLTGIIGNGPQGAILLNDLTPLLTDKKQLNSKKLKFAGTTEQNMRNAIAVAMTKSKQEIPHFYLSVEVDITSAQQWLQQQNQTSPPEDHVILLALLLKALANSLVKYPKLNGFYQKDISQSDLPQGDHFEQVSAIHIGNVISLRQGGLVVPAIHDVDKLSITELMQGLRDITERSRSGHLRSSELMDATVTVTNMGERGADSVFGIIYPPQVAILGFGKVRDIVKVVNDDMVIAQVLTLSLSADHRVIDGMLAAKFLNYLAKKLQKPECL